MATYSKEQILKLDDRYRRNLINSLMGARPAALIGSVSANGSTNLAVFSQVLHIGANPPLCGILFRPDSVERHTLTNIRETRYFSMNILSAEYADNVHQTSARYGADISEFDTTGLESEFAEDYIAPLVTQAHIRVICEMQEEIKIAINGTILVIGAIKWIEIEDSCLRNDGSIDHYARKSLAVCGLDDYASLQQVARFGYAKPDQKPEKI
jgi:flavin reductase (DIM6/NTAB) family NADH-FMN oxidoreductase RutF